MNTITPISTMPIASEPTFVVEMIGLRHRSNAMIGSGACASQKAKAVSDTTVTILSTISMSRLRSANCTKASNSEPTPTTNRTEPT